MSDDVDIQAGSRGMSLTEVLERYPTARVAAELAHLRDANRRLSHGHKIWPGYIQCDGCTAVVAFDPLPEEAVLVAALIALRWSVEVGHRCPRCKR